MKAILNSIQVEDFHVTSKYLSMEKIVKQDALNFFNEAFNAAVPIVNAYFANFYYDVQEDIWQAFKIQKIELNYFDQYLQLGTNPIFIPPPKQALIKSLEEKHVFL